MAHNTLNPKKYFVMSKMTYTMMIWGATDSFVNILFIILAVVVWVGNQTAVIELNG